MPDIFKALASITAWGLFIFSWIIGFSTAIMGIINGVLYGEETVPMVFPAFFAVAIFCALSSVVVMVLRKKME